MNPDLALWPLVACAVMGAAIDLKERRLPNWLCLLAAVIAGFFVSVTGGVEGLTSAFLHCGLALMIGMGLFRIGFVGGGDAKFYAALAIAFPLSKALSFLGWTSLLGLVLVLAMVILRAARKAVLGQQLAVLKFSVPYGVAIGGGATITLLY